jgi:hypothetical protein
MISNRRPPLTPFAQDALDALASAVPADGELTYEDAYDVLAQEEDLQQPAAEDIIEQLYMRGHLYEVESKLRLTDYGSE